MQTSEQHASMSSMGRERLLSERELLLATVLLVVLGALSLRYWTSAYLQAGLTVLAAVLSGPVAAAIVFRFRSIGRERLLAFTANWEAGVAAALTAVAVVVPAAAWLYLRHTSAPYHYVHDGVIQIEEAIKFLLAGKDPYAETYANTPLAQWYYDQPIPNPALYYVAYLPFMFLAGVPLYLLSVSALGWYDQRFVYYIAFAGTLLVFWKLARSVPARAIVVIAVALNPLFGRFLVEGRNDVVGLCLIGLSIYALNLRARSWNVGVSGALFGLACATKQSVWFLGPFYALYLLGNLPQDSGRATLAWRVVSFIRSWLLPAVVVFSLVVLPFLFWNAGAFIEDTVDYPAGTVVHNYPVPRAGAYGFHILQSSPALWAAVERVPVLGSGVLGRLLQGLRVENALGYYPFWKLQIVFALPLFLLGLRLQWKHNTLTTALAVSTVSLYVFMYFSRFFHDNYIGYLATLLGIAYTIRDPFRVQNSDYSVPQLPADVILVALIGPSVVTSSDSFLDWTTKAVVTGLIGAYLALRVVLVPGWLRGTRRSGNVSRSHLLAI